MSLKSKVGLGTVQFGIPYGISNIHGQTTPDEVAEILNVAKEEGISVVDTASAYGTSEARLGNNPLTEFKVVSKFMPVDESGSINEQLNKSLRALHLKCLYGYLSHRPMDLLAHPDHWIELNRLKDSGLIKKIGFSFNAPSEVERMLSLGWMPDLIQVPFNYLDKRFKPYCKQLKDLGCEVHTRSAFLQGLFFKNVSELPPFFDSVKPVIRELQRLGESLPCALLKYCVVQEFIDCVIIGLNTPDQLTENLKMIDNVDLLPHLSSTIAEQQTLDPSEWPMK